MPSLVTNLIQTQRLIIKILTHLTFSFQKKQVSIDKAQELSRQLKIPYLECSAKGKFPKKKLDKSHKLL